MSTYANALSEFDYEDFLPPIELTIWAVVCSIQHYRVKKVVGCYLSGFSEGHVHLDYPGTRPTGDIVATYLGILDTDVWLRGVFLLCREVQDGAEQGVGGNTVYTRLYRRIGLYYSDDTQSVKGDAVGDVLQRVRSEDDWEKFTLRIV
jgi:hypothetical protein